MKERIESVVYLLPVLMMLAMVLADGRPDFTKDTVLEAIQAEAERAPSLELEIEPMPLPPPPEFRPIVRPETLTLLVFEIDKWEYLRRVLASTHEI